MIILVAYMVSVGGTVLLLLIEFQFSSLQAGKHKDLYR